MVDPMVARLVVLTECLTVGHLVASSAASMVDAMADDWAVHWAASLVD